MSPQIVAALIAGLVSLVSLLGTVIVAIVGFRTTRKVTDSTIQAAHADTGRTLAEQREQLERTLGEQHVRTLNDRFATAADKLGSDKPPAVRLAGVYAMAKLADDWEENRQTCIDVLCGYLRMRYEPESDREVRLTVVRVITAHLQPDDLRAATAASWRGHGLDFTGVIFDGGDFSRAQFTGGLVSFRRAQFTGGRTDFSHAQFTAGRVSFSHAQFTSGVVSFRSARFTDGTVSFRKAQFTGGRVNFSDAQFTGGRVNFYGAGFTGGDLDFSSASFIGSTVDFTRPSAWSHPPEFGGASLSGVRLPEDSGDLSG